MAKSQRKITARALLQWDLMFHMNLDGEWSNGGDHFDPEEHDEATGNLWAVTDYELDEYLFYKHDRGASWDDWEKAMSTLLDPFVRLAVEEQARGEFLHASSARNKE